jgi:arginase
LNDVADETVGEYPEAGVGEDVEALEAGSVAGSAVEFVEESVAHSADEADEADEAAEADAADEAVADQSDQSDDAGEGAGDEPTDHWGEAPDDDEDDVDEDGQPTRMVPRPLGQAPLLDSDPLPATRPGMLRPRTAEDRAGFSLPAQRPAFELDPNAPADIA